MSSTGIDKARSRDQRIADNTIDITKQIIEDTKVFSSTSPAFALSGEQGSSEGSAAGNYLAKSGDIRLGPMGNEFKIVDIIDDTISVSISTANYVPVIILNPEGGVPDDLETIIPGESVFLNQEIILQGGNSTITLKNSDNIITPDGEDLVITVGDFVRLYYSQLLSAWVVAWFSGNVGGGGISFPIDFPEDDRGTVGASTQDILFTDSDRHSVKMIVSGDVDLSFSSPPSNETAYTNIIIVQDGTGGHIVTVPAGTINKAIVDAGILTGPDEETGIVIKYAFGVFYAFLETGNIVTGGFSFSGNLSDLVINVASKDWLGQGISNFGPLTGVTAVQYVDTGSVIRGSISGDAGASAVRLSLATGNKFIISDVITDIVSFDDATGLKIEGSHVINMNNNIINSISKLQLLNFNGHTPSNEISIAFDNVDDELKYSVALTTDAHSWYADTDRLASIVRTGTDQGQLNIHDVISDILQANTQFIMSDSSLDPGFNGEFRRNGIDVKVFSGGAVRNLSDIGSGGGANQQLDNLSGTVRPNQDLLADQSTGGNLGSPTPGDEWFNLFSRRVTFSAATSIGTDDYSFGRVNTPSRVQYNVPTGAVHRWTINGTNEMELTNVELILNDVNLDMENNSITDANQIQITGSSGDTIHGFLSGTAELFDIVANENNSHVRIFGRNNGGSLLELIDADATSGLVNLLQGGLSFGSVSNTPTIARIGNDLGINVASTAELNLQVGVSTKINIRNNAVEFFIELIMDGSNQIDFAQGVNSATIGSANALPGVPAGYIVCKVGTIDARIPFWNV